MENILSSINGALFSRARQEEQESTTVEKTPPKRPSLIRPDFDKVDEVCQQYEAELKQLESEANEAQYLRQCVTNCEQKIAEYEQTIEDIRYDLKQQKDIALERYRGNMRRDEDINQLRQLVKKFENHSLNSTADGDSLSAKESFQTFTERDLKEKCRSLRRENMELLEENEQAYKEKEHIASRINELENCLNMVEKENASLVKTVEMLKTSNSSQRPKKETEEKCVGVETVLVQCSVGTELDLVDKSVGSEFIQVNACVGEVVIRVDACVGVDASHNEDKDVSSGKVIDMKLLKNEHPPTRCNSAEGEDSASVNPPIPSFHSKQFSMRHSERPSEGEVPNDTPCCSPPTSAIVERHYNHTESGHTHTRIENNKNNAHSDSSDIEINVTVSDADIASMSIHREDRTLEYHFAEADIATNSDVHTSPTEGNKSALRRSVRQRKTVCEEKLTPLPTRKRPTHQHEIETPIYTTKQETETSHLTGESITLTQTQDEFACSSQESVDEFACSSQETVDDELRVSKIGKGRGKKNPGKAVAKRKRAVSSKDEINPSEIERRGRGRGQKRQKD